MKYDIFSNTAPQMPRPGKGTEICKLILSQISKDMRDPLIPMVIPALASHLSGWSSCTPTTFSTNFVAKWAT